RPRTSPSSTWRLTPLSASTRPKDLVIFRSSISLSVIDAPPEAFLGSKAPRISTKTVRRKFGHSGVVVRRHKACAGIHVDRRKPVNHLLAKPQDRQIALHEGLLIGSKLHPSALKAFDNLRAGVEAE